MILRTCFSRLQAGVDPDANVARARAAWVGLPTRLRVGRPADADAAVWDLVLIVEADSTEQLAQTLANEAVVSYFAELASCSVVVKAWSFVTASG